ncbi:MAG: hypothetical protein WC791_03645 [Candidatus Paceibacterota bacterium]|jgi:hypothetical protein
MSWHKNTLLKYKKEITQSAVASFFLALVYAVCSWHLGNTFIWESISPIEQPSIFVRGLYSALAFILPGALLYEIGYYKILHDIIVKGFGLWWLYNLIKAVTWIALMALMYFVFGLAIDVLNTIASISVNSFKFILYISPTLGLFLFLTIFISYIYSRIKEEPTILDLERK